MTDAKQQLTELREQAESLLLESQVHALQTRLRQAKEQDRLIEGWGDLIDPMESLRADPSFFGNPYGGRQDRADAKRYGDYSPHFTDEATLGFIRGAGQFIAETDPAGINIVQTLTSYAIANGMEHEVTPKPEAGLEAEQIAAECQAVVDEFLERIGWRNSLDAELFGRTRKAGERFVRVKDIGGGYADAEVHEPSWITEPLNARQIEDYYGFPGLEWKYGVASLPSRPHMVYGYFSCRYGDRNDWEFIPESEMLHVKVNVDRGVKRGLSDFYGGSEEWLTEAKKTLRNIVKGAGVQASIALIRKHQKGSTNAQINSMADGVVEFQSKLPPLYGDTSARNIPTERWYPGKIVDMRSFDAMYGPMGTPVGPVLVQVVDASLRHAGRRWGFPEDMISGNASSTNYASILEAHTPFAIQMKRVQGQEAEADRQLLWRVIDIACKAGRLSYDCQTLRQFVTIDVTPPDIEVRDQQKDHTIRKEQHEAGLLSLRTWSEQESLDHDKEQANITTEPKKPEPIIAMPGQPIPGNPFNYDAGERGQQYPDQQYESISVRAMDLLLEQADR